MLLLLVGVAAGGRAGELTGVVYDDANANGRRDAGEAGLPGVVVWHRADLARTGPDGRYSLPPTDDDPVDRGGPSFVAVVVPDGRAADVAYRDAAEGGGDFALRPAPGGDGFFFVQVSDVHAYDRAADFLAWSTPGIPFWVPRSAAMWLARTRLGRFYPELSDEALDAGLRAALEASSGRDASALAGSALLAAFLREFERPGSDLGAVPEAIRAALGEVAALRPSFVVSTGDLVLEGNRATPAVAERWLAFYRQVTRATGIPFYDTIGNNEIVGIQNDDVSRLDPDYGTGLWRRVQGPTHYAWERGGFHFVALDTHRPTPGFWDERAWSFVSMRPETRRWLDRDLALHAGDRTLVVFNHEPFVLDPTWPFDDPDQIASDDGLFAKHGVRYALCGHTHRNGRGRTGRTEHVTTGALSGFRWLLPADVHERGYRLWYARAGRLYGAWKRIGEPVLALAEPAAEPDTVVVVAADRAGPFASVELRQAGAPIALERWGDYFARASWDPAGGALELVGRRADGTAETAALRPPAP